MDTTIELEYTMVMVWYLLVIIINQNKEKYDN